VLPSSGANDGAFSRKAGTVDLSWKQDARNGPSALTVIWCERGGPKTSEPKAKGFGRELIERAIPNATVKREFAAGGVTCTIEAPLPKVAAGS
jgi:two-component system, chemotaxis family, CheB/CheR fusion protein